MTDTATEYDERLARAAIANIGAELRKAVDALERATELYRDLEDMQEARPVGDDWELPAAQRASLERSKARAGVVHGFATSMARKLGVPNV